MELQERAVQFVKCATRSKAQAFEMGECSKRSSASNERVHVFLRVFQMARLRVFKRTTISAQICLGRVRSVPQLFLLCWFNVQFELVRMLYALCFMWCMSSFSILPLSVYVQCVHAVICSGAQRHP